MRWLSAYIRSLSSMAEFWIVIVAAFVPPIANSQMFVLGLDARTSRPVTCSKFKESETLFGLERNPVAKANETDQLGLRLA
jgi:hypothetical protein